MAYYRMSGSSKGEQHGASILVEIDGTVASGDTVTLTMGDTYSQTKEVNVSTKNARFDNILEAGTYTATFKTFSESKEVTAEDILSKGDVTIKVSEGIQITLTLEGAKEDNITITKSGSTWEEYFEFGSGETTCTKTIILPEYGEYTFTSSVAKDTTDGTSNYSKNVNLTNNSPTTVKVMPDNSLYWYGNECTDVTGGWVTDGIAVKNVNNIFLPNKGNANITCSSSNVIDSSYCTKMRFFEETLESTYTVHYSVWVQSKYNNLPFSYAGVSAMDTGIKVVDSPKLSNDSCEITMLSYYCGGYIHSVWLE